MGDDMPDWRVTYQSRVGPLEWIRPYTDDEIRDAGAEGTALVVVPVVYGYLDDLSVWARRLVGPCGTGARR